MAKKEKKQKAAPAAVAESPKAEEKAKKKPKKLTRKEKKERYKEQLALEKKLVEEGRIPPRAKYAPRGVFWRMFAVCLSFFFGMFACLGGLVGGAVILGTLVPAKDALGLFGIDDYTQYLREDYGEGPIIDAVSDLIGADFSSLEGIDKVTPFLRNTLEDVNGELGVLGVDLNVDELIKQPFDGMGTYFQDNVVGNIVLGKTLGLSGSSEGLLLSLCYGSRGEDWHTDEEGNIVMNEGKEPLRMKDLTEDSGGLFERITIENALNVTPSSNAAMLFLAYGTEGLHYKKVADENGTERIEMLPNPYTGELFKKKTLSDLSGDGATPIESAKISDLISTEGAGGILGAIGDWKISDLKNSYRIERLRLSQFLTVDENSSEIMQAISDWRIGDLTDKNKMNSLTLGEVLTIGEDAPPILKALKNTRLGDFSEKTDSLRLSDILGADDIANNKLLKNLAMSTLSTLADDVSQLSVKELFGDDLYSYLEIEDGKTFLDLAKAYDPKIAPETEGYSPRPHAHVFTDTQSVRSYRLFGGSGNELVFGYFAEENGALRPVDSADVYREKAEEVTYYAEKKVRLEPVYALRHVNYESGGLEELPEGAISAVTEGYTVYEPDGATAEPYCGEAGERLYYHIEDHLTPNGAERAAFPLFSDDAGIYCVYLKYSPDGGANEYSVEREDFEASVCAYTRDGETAFRVDADGNVTDLEGEPAKIYRTPADDPDGAYDYVTERVPVRPGWYDPAAAEVGLHSEEETEQRFVLTENGEDTDVMLDRYLSGVWHLLFGEEVYDDAGELVRIDENTDRALFDMHQDLTGVSTKIQNTELWRLYLYGIIDSDPYVDLTTNRLVSMTYPDGLPVNDKEKKVKNLNECTVTESITLVSLLLNLGS